MKLALPLFAFLFSHVALASSPSFETTLARLSCARKVRTEVGPRLAKQTWFPQVFTVKDMNPQDGVEFRDTRTQKVFKLRPDGKERTVLIEQDLKTREELIKVWNAKNCEMQKSSRAMGPRKNFRVADGFSDENLQETMKAHDWGIIYVWSPHMPLSVDGVNEISAAVKAKSGHLTILLEPKASLENAKSWVEKSGLPQANLKQLASYELWVREMGNHYPVVYIYKDGFLSNRTFVGHKENDIYQKWIELELAEIKKDME